MIEANVVELGIWFYDEGYQDQARYTQDLKLYRLGAQVDLVIPPHGYEMTQGFHSFDHPVRIDSFQPHGHLRMRAASLEIFYPQTGRTEPISPGLELERDVAPQSHIRAGCCAAGSDRCGARVETVVRQYCTEPVQPGSGSMGHGREPYRG